MFRSLFYLFGFLIVFSLMLVSCRHDSEVPAEPVVSFKNDIQSILIGNCTQDGCHGTNESRKFKLGTYDELMDAGIVSAGDGRNSKIFQVVTGRSGIMPPSSQQPLTNRQILLIYVWIEQGAKNN